MQIVYIQESEVAPELIRALREKHGQGFGVVITCMAPPLPVLIEQHHDALVQVLAHLERRPSDEALLEQQRELSSTIDALQRAADRVSGVALDQPADGRTIAMRRAFDIRFGRESRDTKAAPMEYLALWAAAWRAAELETMAYIGGAMVCNIDLEPADLAKLKAQWTTTDRRGICIEPIPHQARAAEIKMRWLLSEIVDRLQLVKACAYRLDSGAIAAELEWLAALHGAAQSWGMFDQQPATPAVEAPAAPLDDSELEDLAHSANQECLSFGMSLDPFLRLAKTVRDRMLAAAPQAPAAPAEAQRLAQFLQCMRTHLGSCRESAGEYNQGAWDDYERAWTMLLGMAAPAAPAGDASDPALPSWWPDFIQCVAELPDRNSPEGEPDAMIATAEELGACAIAAQAEAKGA